MEYLLFIATDSEAETYDPAQDNIEEWVTELEASGARKHGDRLRPPADATTVRVRNGELLVTDGPFAETKEWIAGYDVLECADLDEAIAIAAKHPMARFGRIEVRPVWPFEG
ncbi:YciI family protein [Lysinimonas soli]|uniref:YciI family protein n=1 Tax=Lysinimonas soli TaxID=1074233 RepID=A0ABW0NQJ8_9MICO